MTLRNALIITLVVGCASCDSLEHDRNSFRLPVPQSNNGIKPKLFDLNDPHKVDELTRTLTEKRALFIGEIHGSLEHHENQFRLIQNLYKRYPYITIGVEYFQQPYQTYLNDYIAGYISEKEMLIKTEYFKRWSVDYRMLQPIFQFAREKNIPVLALNISDEIHNKVFRGGIKSLTPEERKHVPSYIQPASKDYQERLRVIFDTHPESANFDTFVEGQLLWDEAMAEVAANYLKDRPRTLLVVLAGLGHMMYGDGIPKALDRRLGGQYSAIAINGTLFGEHPGIAHFILATPESTALPPPGKLGIFIREGDGHVRITGFVSNGAAKVVGLEDDDRIIALDGIKVRDIADLKAVMFDKRPGDVVDVTVNRERSLSPDQKLQFEVALR